MKFQKKQKNYFIVNVMMMESRIFNSTQSVDKDQYSFLFIKNGI